MESDQVRKDACGKGCDVSVPINMAYNHHHDTAVTGKGAHMEEWSREEAMAKMGRHYVRLDHGARLPHPCPCAAAYLARARFAYACRAAEPLTILVSTGCIAGKAWVPVEHEPSATGAATSAMFSDGNGETPPRFPLRGSRASGRPRKQKLPPRLNISSRLPSPAGNVMGMRVAVLSGGEYRKSLHAYAPPFAQMVESPTVLSGSPMQIDTWNRAKM